ncbi:MAG TPA: TrkH family potassium uptake protein [Defluviitaleaceae bacterium]|nr:TrkH family potassium uptake protein [Candidatus Epulonipiscium sp.]HOQ17495.1 TrkH family potassium uptake protein [Defluviitaleaceae bacterium]HPT76798.1 TrkH family potassium uptake protein [Defluviitaleaceae bacterium]HQD49760.1 TrkH family potassium uptake protein [Defluviitaleaceae bacterium]
MNFRMIRRILGILLIIEAIFMIPPFLISVYYGQQDMYAFLLSILFTGITGFTMYKLKVKNTTIKVRDALAIATFGWLIISFFGALPFVFSRSIPSLVDAFFETVSGFTTTGATLVNHLEDMPKSILFWRSFTHWIGGMGILVFTVAFLPAMGVGSFQIFKAESPGPTADRLVPRIKDSAKLLYMTYFSFTIVQIIFLLFGKMSLFEAVVYTFGTVGTGGFATEATSIAAYDSVYIHIVIAIFMFLSGINYSLYYSLFKGKWRDVVKNQEFKLYLGIIFVSTILITVNLMTTIYHDIGTAFKDAFFQVNAIITTTGYAIADFDLWPAFSKAVLFMLMFVGGCAGSTAGGIKVIRILTLLKLIKREIQRIFHPRAQIAIKNGENIIQNETASSITSFCALYFLIFILSIVIVSLDGFDLETTISAVATTLGNVGPGFNQVGPMRTFSVFSAFSKITFSILMLLGRLELFTMIAIFSPEAWKKQA